MRFVGPIEEVLPLPSGWCLRLGLSASPQCSVCSLWPPASVVLFQSPVKIIKKSQLVFFCYGRFCKVYNTAEIVKSFVGNKINSVEYTSYKKYEMGRRHFLNPVWRSRYNVELLVIGTSKMNCNVTSPYIIMNWEWDIWFQQNDVKVLSPGAIVSDKWTYVIVALQEGCALWRQITALGRYNNPFILCW